MTFREERRHREAKLMSQLEKALSDLKTSSREHNQELLGAKMIAETERLALKSEMDVKLDLFNKEVQLLQEERR